ncbi:hypothetical protein LCGC14_2138570 [marine sediment metagenome]|uniref:DUF3826 domain-containing protein n=1 Tax=marine sediment metagenome TaxID=412755 RepID=A0A0F9GC16_9ZZZZ
MKRLSMILAAACIMAMAAGSLPAQEGAEAAPKPRPKRQRKPRPPKKKRPLLRGMHARMAEVCGLSEDQQKQIAGINTERGKARKAHYEETKDQVAALREAMKKAKESKDKEANAKARKEYSALSAKGRDLDKKFVTQIMAVLTPEQKVKWDEYQFVLAVKRKFRAAKLTDEQVNKVKALYVKEAAVLAGADKKAKAAARNKLYAKVSQEILTEEQRTAVAVAGLVGRYRKLKLTDDQLAQLKAAYVKNTTGVNMTDRNAARQAMNKVTEALKNDILTPEQREQIKSSRPPRVKKPRVAKPKAAKVGTAE